MHCRRNKIPLYLPKRLSKRPLGAKQLEIYIINNANKTTYPLSEGKQDKS